jgi:hypothetical protein
MPLRADLVQKPGIFPRRSLDFAIPVGVCPLQGALVQVLIAAVEATGVVAVLATVLIGNAWA